MQVERGNKDHQHPLDGRYTRANTRQKTAFHQLAITIKRTREQSDGVTGVANTLLP